MYAITNWDTKEVIAELTSLSSAKSAARGLGHNGKAWGNQYGPVAYVADENGGCIYNPVFRVGKDDDFKPTPIVVLGERQATELERGLTRADAAARQTRAWDWPGLS